MQKIQKQWQWLHKEYDTVTFQQKGPKVAITINYTLNLKTT